MIILSIEYLFLCILIFTAYKSNLFAIKLLGILGATITIFGFFAGIIGTVMFIVISQDYNSDGKYLFKIDNKIYETRRYSFGFATLADTRYSFKTYRIYPFLLLERKIDKTWFFDDKTDLIIGEPNLKITIIKNNTAEYIVFKSTNGHRFTKAIK